MSEAEWEYSDICCSACGRSMREASCWKCLGAGEFDLYEEDPLWYDFGDFEVCDECDGVGVNLWCLCGSVEAVTDD